MSKDINIRDFADRLPSPKYIYHDTDNDNLIETIESALTNGAPAGLSYNYSPDGRVEVTFSVIIDYSKPEEKVEDVKSDEKVEDVKSDEQNTRLENQLEALRWLQGKTRDEFVLAWIQVHKESLERAGGTPERN